MSGTAGHGNESGRRDSPTANVDNVDNAPITTRLGQLAPLHQRAALARAAENIGGEQREGRTVRLVDLRTAECPPEVQWHTTHVYNLPPGQADIERRATSIMRDLAWCESLSAISGWERKRVALARAEAEVWDEHVPVQVIHEMQNKEAYERGQALRARLGALVAAVGDVLDGLDHVIPHSRIAALPDDEVAVEAEQRATAAVEAWRWRVAMSRRAGTADTLPDA